MRPHQDYSHQRNTPSRSAASAPVDTKHVKQYYCGLKGTQLALFFSWRNVPVVLTIREGFCINHSVHKHITHGSRTFNYFIHATRLIDFSDFQLLCYANSFNLRKHFNVKPFSICILQSCRKTFLHRQRSQD